MNGVAEALRADAQYPWRKIMQQAAQELDRQALLLAEAEAALHTIATPKRPDGTYNLGREACEAVAQRALATLAAHATPAECSMPAECTKPVTK